jgi:hypothetical protein
MWRILCTPGNVFLAISANFGEERADDTMDYIVNESGRTYPTLIRGGGAAAILAGLSYAAAGYLDQPDMSGYARALVALLSVATPLLFLGGLLGLGSLVLRRERSVIAPAAFLLGCLGAIWGTVEALGLERALGLPSGLGGWWWAPLFAGLTLMGIATLLKKMPQRLGVLVLTSAVLGWVSLLTDPAFPSVLVPMRPAHVVFAALFCFSAVVWGCVLLLRSA